MNEMAYNLPKSAQIIQNIFKENGCSCNVIELPAHIAKAIDAAPFLGCELGQFIKSLIFRTHITHQPVLVLASIPNRVDENCIELLVKEKINKAEPEFVLKVTGFPIGAVPPLGHAQKIAHIFIDSDLMKWEETLAGAGTLNTIFKCKSRDLVQMTGGKVIHLAVTKNTK